MSHELLGTARRLAKAGTGKPRQADLKRAVSAAYYALFHEVARQAADRLVGVGTNRPDQAWRQAYRALNHGDAKKACQDLRKLGFPVDLVRVGNNFRDLQAERQKPTTTRCIASAAPTPSQPSPRLRTGSRH